MAEVKRVKKKKKSIVARVFFFIGLILSAAGGVTAAAIMHQSDNLLEMMNYDEKSSLNNVDLSKYKLKSSNDVVNILLVGADKNLDEQNQDVDRRSDSMMIATIDLKNKKLKITSLMRDMYLDIPGYRKNKLNAAYSMGGIELLYKTIAQNFGVKMDGYAEVNFDAFINVIDELGGVEATLTESEYKNLNTTNYIKRKKYRKLKEGKQILNGYQTLGYCRIRHGKRQANGILPAVYTASGKADDYGRTERQRLIMQAILKKVKGLSPNELIKVAKVVLPNITTDISKDEIYGYIYEVIQMGTTEMTQFVLPAENTFTSQKLAGVGSCLVIDVEENKKALKKFIFKK